MIRRSGSNGALRCCAPKVSIFLAVAGVVADADAVSREDPKGVTGVVADRGVRLTRIVRLEEGSGVLKKVCIKYCMLNFQYDLI